MAILLLISNAASFYYYTIFDHVTNIYRNIKQNDKKKLSCSNFLVTSWVYNKRKFIQIPQQKSEAATRDLLGKNVYSEISQNSQEKTCARASFFIKLQG